MSRRPGLEPEDVEVLSDGRVVLVLHGGAVQRPMSTHEVKTAFTEAVRLQVDPGLMQRADTFIALIPLMRKVVLK